MGLIESLVVDNAMIVISGQTCTTTSGATVKEIFVYFNDKDGREPHPLDHDVKSYKGHNSNPEQEVYKFEISIEISNLIGISHIDISVLVMWDNGVSSSLGIREELIHDSGLQTNLENEFRADVQSFITRLTNPWTLLCKSIVALSNKTFSKHTHAAAVCVATYRMMELSFYDSAIVSFVGEKANTLLAEDWRPLSVPANLRWYSSLLMAGGYVSIMSGNLPFAERYFAKQCTLSGMLYLEPQMIFKVVRAGFYIAYLTLVKGNTDFALMQFRQILTSVDKVFALKRTDFTFHEILEVERSISVVKEAIRITLILDDSLNTPRSEFEAPDYLTRFSGEVLLGSVNNLQILVNHGFLPKFFFNPIVPP